MPKYNVKGIRVEYYYTEVEADNETHASMILEEQKSIKWDAVDNSKEIQITGDIKEVK